jgi:hypothetical protein
MHRIIAPDNKDASYDDLESSFSSMKLNDFWGTEFEFPSQGDGGLLGSSVDDLPSSMLKNKRTPPLQDGIKKERQYNAASAAPYDPSTKYIQKQHHRSKKKKSGALAEETQDIYRLGPSLEKKWWKVQRNPPAKKKRHHKQKRRKRESTNSKHHSKSKSLPTIQTTQTLKPEISSSILIKHSYFSRRNTPPNHIYHDAPETTSIRTIRTPNIFDSVYTSSDNIFDTKSTNNTNNTNNHNHNTNTNTNTNTNIKSTQPRRLASHKPPNILNIPYGQEVLDLDPAIMARTVDPYVVQYFAILDIEGTGMLRKRHLVHAVRHSWKIREYLRTEASPPMRQLCRRPGFSAGIAALRTSDPTLVLYPEFRDYCLGLTERREAEIAEEERKERLQRKRIRRKRRVAREEAIRAAEEDLKANSALAAAQRRIEIQMQRTQAETQKEKEMLGEFREDAEKGINGAKRFAGSTRRKATEKAMVMVKEGADRAREKEEAAIKLDEQLRARRTRQELQMRRVTNNAKSKVLEVTIEARAEAAEILNNARAEAEEIRRLGHEKAIDEQREIEERRKVSEDVIAAARKEALSMRLEERKRAEIAHKVQINLIDTMKKLALEECGEMKRRSQEAAKDIERRAEENAIAARLQFGTEQELWRQRAFEEKEAAVKKARSDMVLVLDRAKAKSEDQIQSAMEKAAEIVAEGKRQAQELYRKAKADGENQEALNKLKGSIRQDTERKLREMEKKANDRQALEHAALKRSRRRRSVAMGESMKSDFQPQHPAHTQ